MLYMTKLSAVSKCLTALPLIVQVQVEFEFEIGCGCGNVLVCMCNALSPATGQDVSNCLLIATRIHECSVSCTFPCSRVRSR